MDNIILNYENQIFVSSVSIIELVELYKSKKIKSKKYKTTIDVLHAVESILFYKILPFTKAHTETLAKLKIANAHNDPFDHAIISHAIADKLVLVSSDRKFKEYTTQKLNFVFNKRYN